MNVTNLPLLTFLTVTPMIGAAVIVGLDPARKALARGLSILFQGLTLAIALVLWREFDVTKTGLQFVERAQWIPSLQVDYFLGIDGLGLLMVLLAAFIVPFATLCARPVNDNPRLYAALMLFLQAGLMGAFTALNFVHWFLFYELSLVPAYFLIKFWGGSGRAAAATQFFVYTMVGSVALLLAFLAVYLATGSFDFIALAEKARAGQLTSLLSLKLGWQDLSGRTLALIIFFGAFLGFAVKVPIFPFHTWLPNTYAEAPTSVTMVLTGVMSKMGVYGFLRILLPIFPEQMRQMLTPLLWLAVATIVMSAAAALRQRDLKRIFAYSSVNHLGYCFLGILAAARGTGNEAVWSEEKAAVLNGVLLQMFNHGITASALFCFVGWMEERANARGLNDFGGLRAPAPVFCGLMGIALFASLGLPGLNGFVGEFLIFKGAFALTGWAAVFSLFGLLLTALFLLTIVQRVWNGPLATRWNDFSDLTPAECLVVLPATVLMFALGLCPQILVKVSNPAVLSLVDSLRL